MESESSIFGSYRLLEHLGEGGMGEVWKALDLRLERIVALKFLKSRGRPLLNEARLACQLQHPNIAVVYEAGEMDGIPFIAMEFVEGTPLTRLLGAPMDEEKLLLLMGQACSALQHAHQKGIVHRDIKPANFILSQEGVLKLLDFGVSRRMGREEDHATVQALPQDEDTSVSFSSGTPAYMSPEQARNHPLESASDQFSLGIVLWELACGQHPFQGASKVEILHAILHDSPKGLSHADLSRLTRETLLRMLEKDPKRRFPSMQDLMIHAGLSAPTPEGSFSSIHSTKLGISKWRGRPWRRWLRFALLLPVILLPAFMLFRRLQLKESSNAKQILAVLPLETSGLSKDLEWSSASLQDTLASMMVRQGDYLVLDRLRVAEILQKEQLDSAQLGPLRKHLKADLLILGSLTHHGGRYRLSVRLVRSESGEVLQQLQATASDVLSLEEQIEDQFAPIQKGRQANRSKARNARTRELYTQSLELLHRGQLPAMQSARQMLEEALELEPGYAPAHAALSWCCLDLSSSELHLGRRGDQLHRNRALEEARKAIALDPNLAMAYRVLSEVLRGQGDLTGAQAAAERAVNLDSGDYRAQVALADAMAYQDNDKDWSQAESAYQAALRLNEDYWYAWYRYSVLLQNIGRLEEGSNRAARACELQPTAEYAYLVRSICLLWQTRNEEAGKILQQGLTQVPESGMLKATLAILAHHQKDVSSFQKLNKSLKNTWPSGHPVSTLLEGLDEDLRGKPQAMGIRFRSLLQSLHQQPKEGQVPGVLRTASVNLYHMARAAALAGDKALAIDLLREAERLHPGKWRVAQADPLLRGCNP